MKNIATHQEVTLFTDSSFSQRQWCEKESGSRPRSFSQAEQLEEACWNGLLYELLPEIMQLTTSGKPLFMWYSRPGTSSVQLALCECPVSMEKHTSINPEFFLSAISHN